MAQMQWPSHLATVAELEALVYDIADSPGIDNDIKSRMIGRLESMMKDAEILEEGYAIAKYEARKAEQSILADQPINQRIAKRPMLDYPEHQEHISKRVKLSTGTYQAAASIMKPIEVIDLTDSAKKPAEVIDLTDPAPRKFAKLPARARLQKSTAKGNGTTGGLDYVRNE